MTKFEKQVYDLCVDIMAHSEKDLEITLSGNGTNIGEATNVANAILEMMAEAYGSDAWGEKLLIDVSIRAGQLYEEYGLEEDEEDD